MWRSCIIRNSSHNKLSKKLRSRNVTKKAGLRPTSYKAQRGRSYNNATLNIAQDKLQAACCSVLGEIVMTIFLNEKTF